MTTILDSFNTGANQALSARAGWGAGHYIFGDVDFKTDAVPTTATTSLGVPASNLWGTGFGTDHEVLITFGSTIATTYILGRVDTGSTTATQGYAGRISSAGNHEIVNRGGSTLASGTASAPSAGDSFLFRCYGTLLTLDYRPVSGSFSNVISINDSLYTTGSFIGVYTGGSDTLDEFGGGSYAPPAVTTWLDGTTTARTAAALESLVDLAAGTTQATSRTLTLSDLGRTIECTSATAMALTVPPNASVAFPVGTVIEILQYGAGQVTITPGVGVTIDTPASLTTRTQFSTVALRKRATNEWVALGDLT